LLLLAGFEACSHIGGDQLQIVALPGCLQYVSGLCGSCSRWLGSVVLKGQDGWSLSMLWQQLWQVMSVLGLLLIQGGPVNEVGDWVFP